MSFVSVLNSRTGLRSDKNEKQDDNQKTFDESTIKWAINKLPKMGSRIFKLENQLNKIKNNFEREEILKEYHSLQQDYYDILDNILPEIQLNGETKEKLDKFMAIKAKFDQEGINDLKTKQKIADIKKKIFYGE